MSVSYIFFKFKICSEIFPALIISSILEIWHTLLRYVLSNLLISHRKTDLRDFFIIVRLTWFSSIELSVRYPLSDNPLHEKKTTSALEGQGDGSVVLTDETK